MPVFDHASPAPHFGGSDLLRRGLSAGADWSEPSAAAHAAVGDLVMSGANCLIAALQDCTAESGLNESRYRVLAALAGCASGESTQSQLAEALLQSESNLSTLLERMGADGLILRRRCEADRRRSLIRIAPDGARALADARRARTTALARLMRHISRDETAQLIEHLARLVGGLRTSQDASHSAKSFS